MWWKNFHACTHGLKQGGGGEGGVVLGGVAAKNYQLPSAKQWGKTGQVGVGVGKVLTLALHTPTRHIRGA